MGVVLRTDYSARSTLAGTVALLMVGSRSVGNPFGVLTSRKTKKANTIVRARVSEKPRLLVLRTLSAVPTP